MLTQPGLAGFVLQDQSWGWLDYGRLVGLGLLGGRGGALADGFVGLSIDVTDLGGTSLLKGGFPLAELALESVGVLLLEQLVVSLDMLAEDVSLVLLGVEARLGLFGLLDRLALLVGDNLGLRDVVAWESVLAMGDIETAIASTLHGTEHSVASGGADKTNIEEGLEGTALTVLVLSLDVVHLAIRLELALVAVSHANVLKTEKAAGGEQTGAVGSSIICVTSMDTEAVELPRVGGHKGLVTLDRGVDNLADDSLVGSAHDETVLLAVVLVLLLNDEAFAGLVVRLAFSTTAPLGLVSL